MIINVNTLPPPTRRPIPNFLVEEVHPTVVVKKYKPHPIFLYNPHTIDNLQITSGDEYAYEYVKDERTYFVDTSFQKGMLVLPPAPQDGFKIIIADKCSSWGCFPLIVHRNGKPIMGQEENLACDEINMIFSLKYTNTSLGWVIGQDFTTRELATKAKEEGIYKCSI